MLYLLDRDVKTVKWNGIPLHEASSAVVQEEINGDFYLTVRYPITDSGIYQLIKEDMLIKAPTPVLGPQLFRIKKPVENDDSLDITAYHISDDIMQRSINPVSVVGQGCAMALSQMVQNAKTDLRTFSFTSDIMDGRTFNTTETETLYTVLMDGKHSIVGTWEGELVRDNFALSIKRSRGADRGVVITTHKNLKSYQRTKNSQSVVTRIHAKSTFKAEGADEETTITVTVDSPLISNYPYINEKDYENNNAKTVDELRKWAEAKFKNEGIDKISDAIEIEAYELDGQVIHLGDTVNIKSRKHDVDLYKKAIAYEYNALTEEYISITFDDKPGVGGSGVSSGVSNAADVILGVNANAQEVAVERAIRNANQAFDAEFEKRVEEINDGIEQSRAEAERYADQIKTEISQEFDAFEQEYQVTKQSQSQQIADILAKAQANTILATDAKHIGNQAKADAANVLSKALQYKNEAIAEATRLDTVERQATETKLAIAKSQAISEATRLVETAKSLLSGQISNVSTDLSQTKEAIKLLATKATVDTLTGRVSSAEAMIQVQADQISQRVKTSDFDQAKQRISTAESSIIQLGNRVTTEISETVAKIPTEIGTNNLFILSGSTKGIYKSNLHQDVKSLRYAYGPKILIDSQSTYTLQSWSNILNDSSWLGYSQLDSNGVQIPNTYVTIYPARLQKYYRRDIITHNSAKYIQFSFSDDVFGDTPNLKIKLEKGMIASDWSPAPEDAVAEIENIKTVITQTTYGQEQLSTRLAETQGKVTIAETSIRQLVNVVSSKVSQETFDNLKRTVDSQTTSISQNQSTIALKADKTVTDQLSETVKKVNADLQIASDSVKTKVSQTDFNAAEERLRNAETTINVQSGQIEQRLTSSQVESLVVGKGYATSTVVQNLVKETSDTFKKSISETKKLIPTNFDNTNILSVSNLKNGWFDNKGILQLTTMYVNTDYIELDSNTSYIWQTWTKSSNWAGLVLFDSQKQYITGSYRSVTVDSYVKQTIESGNAKYIVFSFDKSILDGAIKSKLEKGAIATEWVPAYQDLVSTTEFHEVADTVDSHKRTISEQGQSISQVIQTANGLVTKVSALDKSDNLFSFEKSTKGFWIDRNGSAIAGKTYSHSDFLKLASDGTYQLQVWNKSTDKKWIGYTKYTSDKSYISGSYSSFEIESNGYKLLSFTNFDGYLIISYGSYTTDNMTGLEIQFERGLVATAYKLSTLDFATQTQVNTLAGSWSVQNLNSSGDILSQANLSSAEFLLEAAKIRLKGKTLADEIQAIDGSLVQITGKTYIQDGVITSAKIGSLDAGKITSGYLSAARIVLIVSMVVRWSLTKRLLIK
ncbi:phage tail spike protein [Streptococcus suis]|uniref:Extracellular matrix-binding protein ebhB n=2 Tax=Streptococcus suis TaxID=1307 RepID=A0A0Z8UCG6_STRSU|nr:phage tail spike protein [Streptococcus suis]CYX35121.1 Extracellular matrix-binding protein ebhB [Streptococcus suis]